MLNDVTMVQRATHGPGPNEEAMTFWRNVMVDKYRRFRRVLVGATALHAGRALAIHPLPVGARVLDVGCGFGETTLEIARRVGERGEAAGIDSCNELLAVALADAERAGIANASFRCGDAQTTVMRGFDRIFSAFGVMFFAQPVAALRNLHAATKPSARGAPGRMQLLVWGPRADNPWLTLAVEACDRVLPPKTDEGPTCGPGPFSMSDPDVLRAMLESAGLTRIELHGLRDDVLVGADVEAAIDFQLSLGPAGERMRVAGAQGTALESRVRDQVRELLVPYARANGVWLPSSVWYATGVTS